MRLWGRCWKLSLILIVAIGPALNLHLPWVSSFSFAASVRSWSHSMPGTHPISYIIPNAFIQLKSAELPARRSSVATMALGASDPASQGVVQREAFSINSLAAKQPEIYVSGKAIQLLPTGPTEVSLLRNGQIRFEATLVNERNTFWHITVTGTVELANGSKVTVLEPHSLWMVPGQKLRLPLALTADPARFPPGWTQFRALLRDDRGQIIDQASVNFLLTLDLAGSR